MASKRQLAAIMFTDIVGYTALMQRNEEEAFRTRNKHRHIFNSFTEKHDGRVLQYYGDGTLSIFNSAIDAVMCGIEMQLSFRKEPSIPVRIGIHTGDIIFSEEEIIGDSVNVASRIESLAVPGSVFISGKVYDEIKNQKSIKTSLLKTFKLKNVVKPIEIFAIANAGLIVPKPGDIRGKTDQDLAPEPREKKQRLSEIRKGVQPLNILATKLYIPPPRHNVIHRARLIEQLNAGLHRKLTLISASAGFGKTTLLSEWVASCERPTAWLSLDEGDNDPTRFLAYLIATLKTIDSNIGEGVLALLQFPQPPATESILTALLNEIITIPENFLLVLDDYHVIDAKLTDHALSFLLEHQPPQMHLVIATREDPLLPLARLRVRGQLTELRATDLRFTPSEAAGFLNQAMSLNLSANDVAALEMRTEGWIAGLQLAAISMQGHKDATSFIKSFAGSHRFVLDYLIEEVLHQQSENVRTFMLRTSILDRLSGSLCDAVVRDPSASAQETLEYLERANLFIIPLDDNRQWFRYHHLFADVLRARSKEEQPDQVPVLHRRASEWYELNGSPADAIRHALSARNFERAAGLIELAWPTMDENFQSPTWLGWVKALPDELVRNRPVLSLDYAWALLNDGELEAGKDRLQDAERGLDNKARQNARPDDTLPEMVVVDEEQFRSLPASIATAHAYIAQSLGDIPGTVKNARLALKLLPEGDHLQHAVVAAILGLAYWANGDLENAHRALTEGSTGMQMAGNALFAVSATYGLAEIRVAQGRLRDAISTYKQSLKFAMESDESLFMVMPTMFLGLSKIYFEQGNLEVAAQHLFKSEELGQQAALSDWKYRWFLVHARMKEIQGDLEGALDLLRTAERQYFRSPLPDVRPLPALKARVWIAQGRLVEAMAWVHEQNLSVDDELSYLREFEHITLARILLARYKSDRTKHAILDAKGLLKRLLKTAEEGNRIGSVIEILALQALVYESEGDLPQALTSLERAMDLAEPEGYARIFADEGIPMAQLLYAAADHDIKPEYVNKLLAVMEAEKQKSKDISNQPHSQSLIEPLSQRELEVLQLIARGLSNREISEKLFLALSTVKGHNRNIFGKLEVQRRTEAVARARELGLV